MKRLPIYLAVILLLVLLVQPLVFPTESNRKKAKLAQAENAYNGADKRAGERAEERTDEAERDMLKEKFQPADWFFMQRTAVGEKFGLKAYEAALGEALAQRETAKTAKGGASWVVEGPGNIGGRINTLAIDPNDSTIFYSGATAGGIFKTTDAGATWLPIFDDQAYLSIGDIEIDPNNSSIIYAGTGDPNIGGYLTIGDGIYKSTDAGATWTNMGLTDQRIISRLEVHPLNSNVIYAGAMGLPFERNSDRGLYKSTDGGANWSQVLYINDSTGVTDLLLDPTDLNTVYAATWNRIRNNSESLITGADARVYKSTDGGANWTILSGGLPNAVHSRIGLSMDATNANTVYVQIIGTDFETEGIYKTTNGGTSFASLDVSGIAGALGGFGWYFSQIRINPYAPNRMYILGVELWYSDNDGNTWDQIDPDWWTYEVHADKHDLVFLDANSFLLATDGGIYRTNNNGLTWSDIENIPCTQFYHAQVNPHTDGVYWGGAQDNGTTSGNLGSINSWARNYGGDGFHVEFNPDDPNMVFAETQNGGIVRSMDGGFSFDGFTDGIDFSDRRSWDMPYIISPHDATKMYAGTYRLYEHPAPGPDDWAVLTGDLTDGIDSRYHVISTIRESYKTAGTLFVGASDGRLSRSIDGGSSWVDIAAGLPDRYVTDVETSHLDDQIVFVSHSGYRDNDFIPHVHMSSDQGASWVDISGDLPQLSINDLEVYPGNDSIIFAATDGGVYFTLDQGADWERLGDNMPVMLVYDIEFDHTNGKLIAGTFARSIQSIELAAVVPPQFDLVSVSEDAEICQGESVSMEATGGFTYSWSPSADLSCDDCPNPIATPSGTITYTVEIGDCLGHTTTRDIEITVGTGLDLPIVNLLNDTLFSSVLGDNYQWNASGSPIAGAIQYFHKPVSAGLYSVTVFDANGCSRTSDPFSYGSTGIEDPVFATLNLFPVPASNSLTVELPEAAATKQWMYSIYDLAGREMLTGQASGQRTVITLDQLAAGNYLLKCFDNNKQAVTRPFVKE